MVQRGGRVETSHGRLGSGVVNRTPSAPRRRFTVALCLVAGAALGATGVADAQPSGPDTVTLDGSLPTDFAQRGMVRTGAPSSSTAIRLTLGLVPRNQHLADRMLARGEVVSPAEYDRLFGANPSQLNKVAAWARSQGFKVLETNRAAGTVQVESTVASANTSLGVKLAKARKGRVNGLVATSAPRVPKGLGIETIAGLDTTVRFERSSAPVRAAGTSDGSTACSTYWGQHNFLAVAAQKYPVQSNELCGYRPQQVQSMYGAASVRSAVPALGVLLWGDDPAALANLNALSSRHGFATLPAAKYTKLVQPQRFTQDCDQSPEKQNLDLQASHAIAPSASLRYYAAASCYSVDLAAMTLRAVGERKVSTISMSFGVSDERSIPAADRDVFERAFTQAGLTGISIFAASGDFGTNREEVGQWVVGYPASSPRITAVGGSAIGLSSNATRVFTAGWEDTLWSQPSRTSLTGIQRVPPAPWNPQMGANGGNSKLFARPSWQPSTLGSMRAVPDVSALAAPSTGMQVYSSGRVQTVGGTSLASPIVAAMVGAAKVTSGRRVGNAAPFLYKLSAAKSPGLLDVNYPHRTGVYVGTDPNGRFVTVGFDNNPENALVTKAGWDNVTGLGEPYGPTFFSAFGS